VEGERRGMGRSGDWVGWGEMGGEREGSEAEVEKGREMVSMEHVLAMLHCMPRQHHLLSSLSPRPISPSPLAPKQQPPTSPHHTSPHPTPPQSAPKPNSQFPNPNPHDPHPRTPPAPTSSRYTALHTHTRCPHQAIELDILGTLPTHLARLQPSTYPIPMRIAIARPAAGLQIARERADGAVAVGSGR
jgi:hypothetical protein